MLEVPKKIIEYAENEKFTSEPVSKAEIARLRLKFPNLSEPFFKLTEAIGYIHKVTGWT